MFPRKPALLAAFSLALPACAGSGNYVWVNDLPPEPATTSTEYMIESGDLLAIRVLGHDDLSNARARVRDDGRIVMPILGDIGARGTRPSALRAEIEARLKDYVKEPSVIVDVEEERGSTVSVLGEVSHPGVYPIEHRAGVARALAGAGGVTEFADRDRIFVLRGGAHPLRIRFTYREVTRGELAASSFVLRTGDVVVVE